MRPNRAKLIALFSGISVLLAFGGGLAAQEVRTVSVEAEVRGAGRTPEDARHQALQRARELAVAEVAGIHIRAQQIRLKSEESAALRDDFSYLIHTSSQGRIVDELVTFETRVDGSEPIYRARLQADVVMESGNRDPGFTVEVRTLPASATLRAGEPFTVVVTPSRDCYVTVLNLRADGTVSRIYPNSLEQDHYVAGGRATAIPSPDDSFEIRASLGPGQRRTHEQLILVATIEPVSFTPSDAAGGELVPPTAQAPGLSQLNQWLLQVPVERRTEVMLAYEVVE